MSNFAGQIVIVAAGVTAAVLGFGQLMTDGDAPNGEPIPAAPAPIELGTTIDVSEPEATDGIEIEFSTSAALEGDGTMYGVFALKPLMNAPVDQLQLRIEPGDGMEIVDVLGHNWESHGATALVEIGRVSPMKHPEILVELRSAGNSEGGLSTTATYRTETGETPEQTADWRVSKGFKSGEVLVKVREAYSEYALRQSAELAEAKKYDEALELLTATRAANVELGLALRVVGELSETQRQISALDAEIREAAKPKPVVRTRAPRKEPAIAFHYGDRG